MVSFGRSYGIIGSGEKHFGSDVCRPTTQNSKGATLSKDRMAVGGRHIGAIISLRSPPQTNSVSTHDPTAIIVSDHIVSE